MDGKLLYYSERDWTYCFELETGISSDEWLNRCPDNVFVRIQWQNLYIMIHTPERCMSRNPRDTNCELEYSDILKWLDRKVVKAIGWSEVDSVDGIYKAEIKLED